MLTAFRAQGPPAKLCSQMARIAPQIAHFSQLHYCLLSLPRAIYSAQLGEPPPMSLVMRRPCAGKNIGKRPPRLRTGIRSRKALAFRDASV